MYSKMTGPSISNPLFRYVCAVGFGVAGYHLNLTQIDIAFGFSFIFGGFFAFIAIRFLGFFPAVLCAAISSAATYELWEHPYAAIVFTLCVAFLAGAQKYRSWPLLLPDVVFWVAIGGPLIWFGYRYGLGMKADAVMTVVLKQALNNFFLSMAALATIFMATQLSAKIIRPGKRKSPRDTISIRSFFGIILVVFSSVPTIVALVVVLNMERANVLSSAKGQAAVLASNFEGAVENWRSIILDGAKAEVDRLNALSPSPFDVGASGRSALLNADVGRGSLVFTSNLFKWVDDESLSRLGSVHHVGRIEAYVMSNNVMREVDVWLPDIVLEAFISNLSLVAGAKIIREASLSDAQLRSGESVDSRPYIVLDEKRGQSLMQRWREGRVFAPVTLNSANGGRYNVTLPFAPYYQVITDSTLNYLLWAVPFIFSMPLLAWLMTANLYGQILLLSLKLQRAIETETETETETSMILEINEIIRQTNDFRIQMAAQRASLIEVRTLLERIMEVSSIMFFVFPYDQKAGMGPLPGYVSPSCLAILGYPAEKFSTVGWWNTMLHPDDLMKRGAERALRDESLRNLGSWQTEVRVTNGNGGWRFFSVLMFYEPKVELNADETELFLIMIERTEQRVVEQQLLHRSRLADLGVMATGIAHELNQPLDIIKLMATNMEDLVAENEADTDYLLTKLALIIGQVERAAQITNHMRLFGRSDNGPEGPVSLNGLLSELQTMLQPQLSVNNIALELDISEEFLFVLGHANLLEQVILNLIVNAMVQIKGNREVAGDKAHTSEVISLRTRKGESGRWVSIVVADRAGGIDPALLNGGLFDPFVTTRAVGEGTGLGLSVAFGIVTQMGGEIFAENHDGGATFTVRLPLMGRVPEEASLVGTG